MKERPILFSGPMVRALLAGTKTQTRRIVKPQPQGGVLQHPVSRQWLESIDGEEGGLRCPYGQPGDRLWVRETHAFVPEPAYRCSTGVYQQINPEDAYQACIYREGFDRCFAERWRPSIHMPRWASRITLEITAVRVERLQDISEADAIAEGIRPHAIAANWFSVPGIDGAGTTARAAYALLWNTINGHGSWDANPWVWVVEFATASPTNT